MSTQDRRIQVIKLAMPWLELSDLGPSSSVNKELCKASQADHLWIQKLSGMETKYKTDPEAFVDTSSWVDGLPTRCGFPEQDCDVRKLRIPLAERKTVTWRGKRYALCEPRAPPGPFDLPVYPGVNNVGGQNAHVHSQCIHDAGKLRDLYVPVESLEDRKAERPLYMGPHCRGNTATSGDIWGHRPFPVACNACEVSCDTLSELLLHCATFEHRNSSKADDEEWLSAEFIDPRLRQHWYENASTFDKTKAMHEYIHRVLAVVNAPLSPQGVAQMEEIGEGTYSLIMERDAPDPEHLANCDAESMHGCFVTDITTQFQTEGMVGQCLRLVVYGWDQFQPQHFLDLM